MRYISYLLLFFLSIPGVHADIKIGSSHFYPPFIINKYQGFDVDLMNYICNKIKTKCTFVQMQDKDLFKALKNHSIDLAMSGISISPQLEENYLVSLPYLRSRAVFIVPQQSSLQRIADLQGKLVGATNNVNGNLFSAYLRTRFPHQFQLKTYDSIDSMFNDLENGSLAAAFVHESSANYWKNNGLVKIRLLGKPLNVGEGVGIVALPEQQVLIDKINKELQRIENNGIYLNLYKTYFGNDI